MVAALHRAQAVRRAALDVYVARGDAQALSVVLGLATYLERVFAAIDDEQMQQVLGCEYGGLSESYAELCGAGSRRALLRIQT